jgi:hypothetical protein
MTGQRAKGKGRVTGGDRVIARLRVQGLQARKRVRVGRGLGLGMVRGEMGR